MRRLLYMILGVVTFCNISCSEKEEQLPLFDFGSQKYNEPFVGVLSSRPKILVKSLDYPPFSWFKSDTILLSKKIEIEFNEDCIRSKSRATIYLTDTLFRPFIGINIIKDGKICKDFHFYLRADSLLKQCKIGIQVSPQLGDSLLNGYILAKGDNLDDANGVLLQNDNNIIATWKVRQKIGWPIMIWTLWIFCITLLIVGGLLTFKYLFIILNHLIKNTKNVRRTISHSIPNSSNTKRTNKNNRTKKDKKDKRKNKDKEETLKEFLHRVCPKAEELIERIIKDRGISWNEFTKDGTSEKRFTLRCKCYPNTVISFYGKDVKAKAGWTRTNKLLNIDYGYNEFLSYRMPNTKYEIDEYMRFETDSLGRIKKATAEFDKEKIIERIRPNTGVRNEQQRIVEAQDGCFYVNGIKKDDGGHLIQMGLGGCNELLNQVPMDASTNRGDIWRQIEDIEYRECWYNGKHVSVERIPKYKGQSMRPYQIIASTKVEGKPIIINGNKAPFKIDNP